MNHTDNDNNKGNEKDAEEFLRLIEEVVVPFVRESKEGKGSLSPDENLSGVDLRENLGLKLTEEKNGSWSTLETLVRSILKHTVRSGHPMFLDKLYAGSEWIGILGELLIAAINCNVHTFRTNPLLTIIERECVKYLGGKVGFDGKSLDGIFCPGGSYSNLLGIFTALQQQREEGKPLQRERLTIVCSQQGHYSVKTAAAVLGLDETQGVYTVACKDDGTIDVDALEKVLASLEESSRIPFVICTTAGTTVLGAYDDFAGISEVAKRHNIWFHIDGSWGASVALSAKHSHLMKGAHLADSLVWNPHKMAHAPLQCSVLLLQHHVGALEQNLAFLRPQANYLFHDKDDAFYQCDLGLKTLQCGRRADALKLFLMIRFHGTEGIASWIDGAFERAVYLHHCFIKHPRLLPVVSEPTQLNVCVWPLHPSLPDNCNRETALENPSLLAECTRHCRFMLAQNNQALTDFAPLPGLPPFLRFTVNNHLITFAQLEQLTEHIVQAATSLK